MMCAWLSTIMVTATVTDMESTTATTLRKRWNNRATFAKSRRDSAEMTGPSIFFAAAMHRKQVLLRLCHRWLPAGGFARSVSILVGGIALAQAIAVVASPVLTRVYHPSDFGVLQVFISLTGFVMVVAAGRYEFALLLPEDEQSSFDLLGVALFCVCLTTALTAMIVAVFHRHPWMLPAGVVVLK